MALCQLCLWSTLLKYLPYYLRLMIPHVIPQIYGASLFLANYYLCLADSVFVGQRNLGELVGKSEKIGDLV